MIMTQSEQNVLVALEHLMEEFFTPTTTNDRKHEIESQLNCFSSQRDCWKFCIYFVNHTSSQFVSMYALSTIESVINRQWVSLEWEHKVQLKSALYSYLLEQDSGTPSFLRNKLVKLVVDIARLDWPHFYPDFFTNILQLLQSEQGRLLGLVFLRTTSEEFLNARPDLSTSRKEELTRLLQQNIPQVFQILGTILTTLGSKRRHTVTATPPPSPTHPGIAPDLCQQLTTATLRPDNKEITKEALWTIQHLFSWVQLSEVPASIIKPIFYFTNACSYSQNDDDMCTLAMSGLNELLYRKCIPPNSQNLFAELYHNTVQLLREINSSSSQIENLGNDFVDKLSELLALLVEQHLWRLETEPGFSAIEFLSLLFQLTMQLPSAHCYLRCLTVWNAFIKQLKPQNAHKYSEALLGLTTAVLNKIQFRYNQNQLEELNCSNSSDQNETEWTTFIQSSIEVIALSAEFTPIETFNQVLIPWKESNDFYCLLENRIDYRNFTLKIEPSETQRLHCVLRDLSSLTQTLARLSIFFIERDNDYYKTASPIIDSLISKLIESACLANNAKFYHLKLGDVRLLEDFAKVHCHYLSAIKTWLTWFPLHGHHLKQLLKLTLPILCSNNQHPPKVVHAAAHLFLRLAGLAFPPTLLTEMSLMEFVAIAPKLRMDYESKLVVNSAICNVLVRPWGELSQSDVTQRNILIGTFFDELTREFRSLNRDSPEGRVKEVAQPILGYVSNIVDFVKDFPSHSKRLVYVAIKDTTDRALELFPDFSKYPEISDNILVLFLNVLRVLQQQLGVENMKRAVDVFLDVAIRQQQTKNFSGLDKLLQILQIVVESTSSAHKSFLPGILQLCMQHVHPLIMNQANEQPDVTIALLTLLHSILLHRWQYFYVSQVRLGHSPGCSDSDFGSETPQQPAQLLAVLQVFGQALLQPDINIFRTSLTGLEELNSKWKLFHKVLFREELLDQFLTVLLHSLLDRTHMLLNDDILVTTYNMAAVNFQAFFSTFLPNFLQGIDGLTHTQKDGVKQAFSHETDMPTFIQHVQRLINDVRCYRLCNTSLPPGSVIL